MIDAADLDIEPLASNVLDVGEVIAEELALPPVKIHCSILAEDAIKAAVQDYKAKKAH